MAKKHLANFWPSLSRHPSLFFLPWCSFFVSLATIIKIHLLLPTRILLTIHTHTWPWPVWSGRSKSFGPQAELPELRAQIISMPYPGYPGWRMRKKSRSNFGRQDARFAFSSYVHSHTLIDMMVVVVAQKSGMATFLPSLPTAKKTGRVAIFDICEIQFVSCKKKCTVFHLHNFFCKKNSLIQPPTVACKMAA